MQNQLPGFYMVRTSVVMNKNVYLGYGIIKKQNTYEVLIYTKAKQYTFLWGELFYNEWIDSTSQIIAKTSFDAVIWYLLFGSK